MFITKEDDGRVYTQKNLKSEKVLLKDTHIPLVMDNNLIIRGVDVIIDILKSDYLAIEGFCHVIIHQAGRYLSINTSLAHLDCTLKINDEIIDINDCRMMKR